MNIKIDSGSEKRHEFFIFHQTVELLQDFLSLVQSESWLTQNSIKARVPYYMKKDGVSTLLKDWLKSSLLRVRDENEVQKHFQLTVPLGTSFATKVQDLYLTKEIFQEKEVHCWKF